jgi:hypothetical protein
MARVKLVPFPVRLRDLFCASLSFAERNGQQVSPLHHILRFAKDVGPVEMTEIFGGNDRDFSKADPIELRSNGQPRAAVPT